MQEAVSIQNDEHQLCGFRIGDGLYAISVLDVQEVIKSQKVTDVPLAPDYVKGLINLRGQIVTSIDLKKLFKIGETNNQSHMNIIVRSEESLYSLIVDEILDVMNVEEKRFEHTPDTINENLSKFISGVYKLNDNLLILLDLKKILSVDL
ncbi:MAG: chemotaxis protein CheW [Halobacteriovoraceae bacterium]|nr:chemotaxis protein CheW [Halobacteriovoraceae bacterium]